MTGCVPKAVTGCVPEGGDPRWRVRRASGPARALVAHPWPDPPAPTVWVLDITRPAVVLGSTQAMSTVDAARAEAQGVDVVRRLSGGGAVLVEPGSLVWVDVVVPPADPLWEADVGRAFAWLGRAWAGALADAGVTGADVYDGPLRRTSWSGRVCFAGLGPGEVVVGGAKVVGMCQRRTRAGALFQSAALLTWEPERLLGLLDVNDDDRRQGPGEVAGSARAAGADPDVLVEALLARLP